MAAPHIAAAAEMIKYSGIATTPSKIESTLISMCYDFWAAGYDVYYGKGMPCDKQLADFHRIAWDCCIFFTVIQLFGAFRIAFPIYRSIFCLSVYIPSRNIATFPTIILPLADIFASSHIRFLHDGDFDDKYPKYSRLIESLYGKSTEKHI